MKKLIALFLVIALFASLGVTAWAAEGGTPFADPMAPANRAMTVNILWVMAGQPVVDYAPGFEDVSGDANYMDALRWAASEGIVKGYDAKSFGPADLVSREQLAVMLYRLAQKHGLGFTGSWMFPLNYSDAGDVSAWANEAVHWMVMNGIMEDADGKLLPAGQVTRRDMIHMTAAFICGAGAESVSNQMIQIGTSSYYIRIPGSYVTGNSTDAEVAEGAVAYYYSGFSDMDFDIYQFSKDGYPADLMDYAAKEAAEYGAVADRIVINGVPVALYYAVEAFEDSDYKTLTAIVDAGDDYVELVFWTWDLFTDYEAQTVLHTLTSESVSDLILGKWILTDRDGKPVTTNEKVVYDFVSDSGVLMSASFTLPAGDNWTSLTEADVAVNGSSVTLTSQPDDHTNVVDEYVITAINNKEFTADYKTTTTVDGINKGSASAKVRFVKVDVDYSSAIIGSWEGRSTSAGSAFDDGKNHRWSYHADGDYVYYIKGANGWVPSNNTLNEYVVAGNLLCTRWVDNGVENREWWEIAIDGDTMYWTGLREAENGSSFTVTYEMTRVDGADSDEAGLLHGMWMLADKDGKPVLTNEKGVFNFVSSSEAYASASLNANPERGALWIDLKKLELTIVGNKITVINHPGENVTVRHEYTITAINDDEFFADLTITANGTETLADKVPVRFVKVDEDYSTGIIGTWEGRRTSDQSKFGDVNEHLWEYRADGTYVFSLKNDAGEWIPMDDEIAEYFVAGNLLCTRWKNAEDGNEENREWWEITIDGDTMYWTGLRADDDGTRYTATFEMARVTK